MQKFLHHTYELCYPNSYAINSRPTLSDPSNLVELDPHEHLNVYKMIDSTVFQVSVPVWLQHRRVSQGVRAQFLAACGVALRKLKERRCAMGTASHQAASVRSGAQGGERLH
jgi:hypothetical protein